jgi:uncharacterized protein
MTTLNLADPRAFALVGGFLGRRFDANREARLKDVVLSEQFIRLHEGKQHDDWFWMGEQVGKWLDAAAYAALIAKDDALLARVEEVLDRLAASQEPDGYLGVTSFYHRNPVRGMELYEMYYVLHGLLVCADLLDSQVALETATRLGDYIIETWGTEPGQFPLAGRYPGNGHTGGEGTLILEPIVMLGQRTGDARFIEWGEATLRRWDAWLAAHPESTHTCGYLMMKQFAAGEKDVWELRENIHAHTYHMTLLGIAALYNATGKEAYREVVLASVDRLADEWIFLTGGMSSLERYVPRRYYHHRNQIEVCPQHTWILLLAQALAWTGNPRYVEEIERDLFNHFLAAQLSDGSNWSYFTPLNGQAREPSSPNCCNAAGHRIAGRMPTYLYGARDGAPAVLMYTESDVTLSLSELPDVRLRQETAFPAEGDVVLRVDPEAPARFALHLRIPTYAAGAAVEVNGEQVDVVAGSFAVIDQEWQPGDVVRLSLPLKVTAQANEDVVALTRGPLVYAYFQDAQAEAMVFHGRRGMYPEDVVLELDPEAPLVTEGEGPVALLGPALSVKGYVRSKAPIFAQDPGNAQLCGVEPLTVTLLPFVNQGAVRGEYGVFMGYRKG